MREETARLAAAGHDARLLRRAAPLRGRARARRSTRSWWSGRPATSQRARRRARDGLAPAEADARLAAQLPIDEKARRADFVVENDGPPETLGAEGGRGSSRTSAGASAGASQRRAPCAIDLRGGPAKRVQLVTGYPGFIGKRLVRRLAASRPRPDDEARAARPAEVRRAPRAPSSPALGARRRGARGRRRADAPRPLGRRVQGARAPP